MLESIAPLLSAMKQTSPILFFAVALAAGAVIFGGDRFVEALGLRELREAYWPHIGIAFLLSTAILVAQSLAQGGRYVWRKRQGRRALAGLHDTLRNLTPDEKAYLVPFIYGRRNTLTIPIQDGIAGGLIAKNILYRSSNIGHWSGFAHNLQPWAREYLEAHPEVLEGANLNLLRESD